MFKKFFAIMMAVMISLPLISHSANVYAAGAPVTLVVSVEDGGGNPVPDAQVYFANNTYRTGFDGKFAVGVVNDNGESVSVLVYKPGFNPVKQTLTYAEAEALPGGVFTVTLAEGTESCVVAKVTTGAGIGVYNAEVRTLSGPLSTTDTYGMAYITGLAPGSYASIVSLIGLADSQADTITVPDTTNSVVSKTYSLTGTGTSFVVGGTVEDAGGNRLSGVTVTAAGKSAVSDTNGYYTIGGFPLNSNVSLSVSDTRYQASPVSVPQISSDITNKTIVATQKASVVSVKDADTGLSISGATVYFRNTTLTTDAYGTATIGTIGNGEVLNVSVEAYGYNPNVITVTTNNPSPVVTLQRGAFGGIRAGITSQYNPAPDAALRVLYGNALSQIDSISDTSGMSDVVGMAEGNYTVTASKAGYNTQYGLITVSRNKIATTRYELGAGGGSTQFIIYGRVTDDAASPKPLSGVTVTSNVGGTLRSSTTDSQGYYAIGYYNANDIVDITASSATHEAYTTRVTVANADTLQNIQLQVPPPLPKIATKVYVSDEASGLPIANASVYFRNSIYTTGFDGNANLGYINYSDTLNVLVTAPNYSPSVKTIAYNDVRPFGTFQMQMSKGDAGAIKGSITENQTGPSVGAYFRTVSGGSSLSDSDGTVDIVGLPEGTHTTITTKSGYNTRIGSVNVYKNVATVTTSNLTSHSAVGAKYIIYGHITSTQGNANVNGIVITDNFGNSATTDSFGFYAIGSNVPYNPNTEVTLTVNQAGHKSFSEKIMVYGSDVPHDIELSAIVNVKVTVRDAATNLPMYGATVYYNKAESKTDSLGQVSIGSISSGDTYNILVTASGYNAHAQLLQFTDVNATGELVVALEKGTLGAIICNTLGLAHGTPLTATNVVNTALTDVAVSTYANATSGAAVSDSAGTVIFGSLPEGTYTLVGEKPGYNPKILSVLVQSAEVTKIDMILGGNGLQTTEFVIKGRVLSDATGNDLKSATISDGTKIVTADINGYFVLGTYKDKQAVTFNISYGGFNTLTESMTIENANISRDFRLTRPLNPKVDPYMVGYPDNTFRPNGVLTRAEIAQIVYNLYANGSIAGSRLTFPDVEQNSWEKTAVSYVVSEDIMPTMEDGSFNPDAYVSRGELCDVIARVKQYEPAAETHFEDIEDNPYKESIEMLFEHEIITGYPDDTFRPESSVTRQEAVTMLGRVEDRTEGWIGDTEFTDINEDFYGYQFIMNAVNGNRII